MAPIVPSEIPDLDVSSLELDPRSIDLPAYLDKLSFAQREALVSPPSRERAMLERRVEIEGVKRNDLAVAAPITANSRLTARDPATTRLTNPAAGSVPPEDINMKGIQALFALIGVAFVLGAIWFFFWAKNGGFQWRKGDWEEYKSTVLRRKGPNGTTLSNATKSTKLGGGSVVGEGYSDASTSECGAMTELSSEAPVLAAYENRQAKKKEKAREKKMREVDAAEWEGGHDNDMRAYRHEKVARVGGINKESESQAYGTDYSASSVSHHSHNSYNNNSSNSRRQQQQDQQQQQQQYAQAQPPRRSPHATRQPSPEKRASGRRDFGTNSNSAPGRPARYHSPNKGSRPPSMPGSWVGGNDWDVQSQNTKSYHHPIPGLGGAGAGYKAGGGYRRDRRDSLDD